MKLLPLIFLLPALAHAGSWFEFEAGIGATHSKDMGDGIWVQQGAPGNRERMRTPAYVAGITGDITPHLAWHVDYVYFGTLSASVNGVPDDNYNPHTHRVTGFSGRYSPFNGQGHTQGVMVTLEPHTTWHGVRFGIEAGPFIYRATWHESLYALDNQWHDLSHRTVTQLGAVAGVSIGAKDWKIAYRYFYQKQKWNPYPGIVTGTHMLTLERKF